MPEIIDRIKAIASQNKIKIRNTITSKENPSFCLYSCMIKYSSGYQISFCDSERIEVLV
jgi:hypothetical protein